MLDEAKQAAVWERVRGTGEDLPTIYFKEEQLARLYGTLSKKLWQEKQCQLRTLRALVFLETGERPEDLPQPRIAITDRAQALRSACLQELEAAKQYFMREKSELSEIYHCLAEKNRSHAKYILQLLGYCL